MAEVVAFAFGLAASSFFPIIIMGVFWKRATKEGAIAGMASGIVFTAAYIIYFKFVNKPFNNADHWFLGISAEGIGMIGMMVNFVVMTRRLAGHAGAAEGGPGPRRQPPVPEGVGPPGRRGRAEGGRREPLVHAPVRRQ